MARNTQQRYSNRQFPGLKALKEDTKTSETEPTSYVEGLLADRRAEAELREEQRKQAIADQKAKLAAQAVAFRDKQVELARTHEWVMQLKAGTSARIVEIIFDNFAGIIPPNGVKRTDAAVAVAVATASDRDVVNKRGFDHGVRVARKALNWAYDELQTAEKSEKEEATVSA